jgi:hypothetical protein
MEDDYKQIFRTEVLGEAKPIPRYGVEYAWPTSIVSEVVSNLEGTEVAILGGDVYSKENEAWELAIPNWYTNIEPGESWRSYVSRSHTHTVEFLKEYYAKGNFWFVLVVASKPTAAQLAKSYAR